MSTHVRIQVLIEIDSGSSWSDDCPVSQLREQAVREGVQRLRNVMAEASVACRIIGDPVPTIWSLTPNKPN
jgi:hypothetical protein